MKMSSRLPKKLGKPKAIKSPEKMWELFLDYVKDVDAHPAIKQEVIKSGERAGQIFEVKMALPYTWVGFEAYLGRHEIICSNLSEYKTNRKGGYEDYSEVVKAIDKTMYDQKFGGAAIGNFNQSIIAMDLGLAAKQIIESKVEEVDFDYSQLSDEALAEITALKDAKAKS
jgi:hypothetical protein